ncbi:N-acetyltransferase [Actinocatenispora thailandica]|uniref:Lysine N-acyltransferase MbtK n=1 Tax=Actinocatenispora thailandica TaxID=227318 RepID=A0A7R7DJQ9_9ACTN|nr:GNAT family N-acetyltransferase [Actinocatenispora thailandica]BCJ32702.1 N-acetyltransferase [Actinocatenispora thailandica]
MSTARHGRALLPGGFSAPTARGVLTLRPVLVDDDLELVHDWLNRPHVARFWQQAWPRDRVRGYLTGLLTDSVSRPMLGLLAGVPVSYWEIYRAIAEPVGAAYPAEPGDLGLHVLIGEPALTGRGLGRTLLGAVRDGLFAADPACTRVVAEPDVRNTASVRAFQRAGFTRRGEIELPDKTAALLVAERAGGPAGTSVPERSATGAPPAGAAGEGSAA